MITVEFNRLGIKPGFKILDIGSGPGRHTAAAYQHEKVTAIGADLSFTDLTEAKKRLEYHDDLGFHGGGTWGLTTADITGLPFRDSFFDAVICSEVMEHIPDDSKAAEELARIVKPGCVLAVSVPRFWPEKICWALSDDYFNANQGHVRIYKKNQIKDKFTSLGLEYIGSHHAHSLHSPYWWLKCFFGPTKQGVPSVELYHRFLVWDIMKKPAITKLLDRLLNPVMGKSLVLYFRK